MKNGFFLFLGLFAALAISWGGLTLGVHSQLDSLVPYYDAVEGKAFPEALTGQAARGLLVYQDLGCISCHTQQVRREGLGSDIERGWGERQSWARDYIFQSRVQLGALRAGPDLSNVGSRITDPAELYELLYHGGSAMPAYPFLFRTPPDGADLSGAMSLEDASGDPVVPTDRARDLVAYLLDLTHPYNYAPEVADNTVSAETEEAAQE